MWKRNGLAKTLSQDAEEITKFWATRNEVKQKLKEVYEKDEKEAIKHLSEDGVTPSQSSNMFVNWNLDRNKIKTILRSLADDRTFQTTFGNLIGGTRFKAATKGILKHTICPNCKENLDSWSHCVECYKLQLGEIKNEKQWLLNIRLILEKIKTETPGKYTPSNSIHTWYK